MYISMMYIHACYTMWVGAGCVLTGLHISLVRVISRYTACAHILLHMHTISLVVEGLKKFKESSKFFVEKLTHPKSSFICVFRHLAFSKSTKIGYLSLHKNLFFVLSGRLHISLQG